MKKVALLVGIVVVVAAAAVIAVRYYPQLLRSGAAVSTAGAAGEPAKTVANVPAKSKELSAEAKMELEEINKIADPKLKQERLVRFYSEHDVDRAISLLEESMKVNPDPANWLPSAQLVECYVQKGDLVNAEKYLKNVMQGGPNASYAYRIGAKVYAQKKDFAKANEMLDKALKLCEDNDNRAYTYGAMGEVSMQQGDKEKARENLQKALKLVPKNPFFTQLLTQLDESKGK